MVQSYDGTDEVCSAYWPHRIVTTRLNAPIAEAMLLRRIPRSLPCLLGTITGVLTTNLIDDVTGMNGLDTI